MNIAKPQPDDFEAAFSLISPTDDHLALQPHELFKAQGFPDDYQIEHAANGKRLSKTAQVRLCGNSVCPPIAQALVKANYFVKQEEVAA